MVKTYSAKLAELKRQWYILDAASAPLGRVANLAAKLLIGKHKPTYTPHLDGGDSVIVINTDELQLTGKKLEQKTYYRHSGYPGNLKSLSAAQMKSKDSTQILYLAVKGMLPKNKLQAERLKRLRLFKGDKHNLEAQKPTPMEVK